MVRDGYYYACGFLAAAALLVWLAGWPYAVPAVLLAAFFLWFFRDPTRRAPDTPGAIVSPADGTVTAIEGADSEGMTATRISIFLNVFNVHVNRSPIAGVVRKVEYRHGKFGNAMGAGSSARNEQNIVTVEGEGQILLFKQIAGLLARRIVFTPRVGDFLQKGQRVGMIKFGSRVDVIFRADARCAVKIGDRVKGGASILALQTAAAASHGSPQPSATAAELPLPHLVLDPGGTKGSA